MTDVMVNAVGVDGHVLLYCSTCGPLGVQPDTIDVRETCILHLRAHGIDTFDIEEKK